MGSNLDHHIHTAVAPLPSGLARICMPVHMKQVNLTLSGEAFCSYICIYICKFDLFFVELLGAKAG